MSKTVYIFCNGILCNPEDVQAWTDRAEVYINKNTECRSTKYEYFSGVLTRRIHQAKRVENLQKICQSYLGQKIILVGHSNGCDIIVRLINKGMPKISEAHLIAGACEANFRKNGLNEALKNGSVDKVFVYKSPADIVLKRAKLSTKLFGWMGLGYGFLGLVGPKYIDKDISYKVKVIERNFSHSEWFVEGRFEETMNTIIEAK